MEIYKEGEATKKNWAITLIKPSTNVYVAAVDAYTGMQICAIILFGDNGTIELNQWVDQSLEQQGYNPYDHNMKYNEMGQVQISGKVGGWTKNT